MLRSEFYKNCWQGPNQRELREKFSGKRSNLGGSVFEEKEYDYIFYPMVFGFEIKIIH